MTILEQFKKASQEAGDNKESVIKEIIEYFKTNLKVEEWLERVLQNKCNKTAIDNRRYSSIVEYWQYHSGCSPTNFYCLGVRWVNPENHESNTYKNVKLTGEVSKTVVNALVSMCVSELQKLEFAVSTKNIDSNLDYPKVEIIINW